MKLAVCVKRVPDTATDIKIAPDKKSIDTSSVNYILNPYDEYSLESALRLREATGPGEVVVVSIGPPDTTKEIRTALAMGADRAILLRAPHTGLDSYSTAAALAGVLKELAFDVVFFGARAVDTDNFQVGPMVSEMLRFPLVTEVVEVVAGDGGKILATREQDGGQAKIAVSPPCGVTFHKGVHDPRLATLPGIMKAKKKPLEEREAALPPPRVEVLSMELPPKRPPGRIVGQGPDAVPELLRLLREEAKVL
ncbi:MAG: electron transfer flavoprotein subunit beta/FixA family protein [Planctomycetes bacterium]|nr:electron transfer flavoprotein subunit beta/FixA family protein [Planctomycetota bacterium]